MKHWISLIFTFIHIFILVGCSSSDEHDSYSNNPSDLRVTTTLSNQRIMAMTQDGDGYMWFGTYRGLNRYNGHEMHQYYCTDTPNSIPDNQIRALFTDYKGKLWVATKNGVARYTDMDDFEQIAIHSDSKFVVKFLEDSHHNLYALESTNILIYDTTKCAFEIATTNVERDSYISYSSYIDSDDNLWIVNHNTIACYNINTWEMVDKLNLNDAVVQTAYLIGDELWLANQGNVLIYDVKNHTWKDVSKSITRHPKSRNLYVDCITRIYDDYVLIGTMDGLFVYDPHNDQMVHQSEANFPFKAPDFNVTGAYTDIDGNLWLSSESQGYSVHTRANNLFSSNNHLRTTFRGKPVASVAMSNDNKLWVAEQHDNVYKYDPLTNKMQVYNMSQVSPLMHNERLRLYYLFSDSRGDIWISCHPKGLLQLRPEGDNLRLVKIHDVNLTIVISEDKNGTIWAGCYHNNYFTKRTDDATFQSHHLFSNTFTYMACLKQLHNGKFATLIKEQGLRIADLNSCELMPQSIADSTLTRCIERNVFLPTSLLEDHLGNLWIGTVSNGLMFYDTFKGELTSIKGTPCDDICSIEEDQQGNIWVSTQFGLAKYNTTTRSFINYYMGDGIGGNEFYDRASCQLPDGTLIFGGAHGLTVFNPTMLTEKQEVKLYFENLKIHNKIVRPSMSDNLERCLRHTDDIYLNHSENSFSISFAALDYCGDDRFSYQYMLDGFNDEWIDAHNVREAFYANLYPNDYNFRVRITSKDHTQVISEKSIAVHIAPAPWATWWAEVIYALLFVGLVIFIARLYVRLHLEQWNRRQSEREKDTRSMSIV